MPTLSKAEQINEANDRAKVTDKTGNSAGADQVPDMTPDGTRSEPEVVDAGRQQPQKDETQRTPVVPETTAHDKKRSEIIARFREQRSADADEETDADQIRRYVREGVPPEMIDEQDGGKQEAQAEEADETPPVKEAAEAAPPKKHKLTVRGKEVELTDEEIVAAAQKHLAADDYLDETKTKLQEVNELLRTTKSQAAHSGQPAKHPGGQNGEQNEADGNNANADGTEHHESPYQKLVEKLQYGEPSEASTAFEEAVDEAAGRKANEALQRERVRNETVRSKRFLKEFQDEHPELANDGFANAAIEKRLYELQTDDIKALGATDAQIPKTPAELAQWHLFYRTEGHAVRDVPTLLKTALNDFKKWKGGDTPKPAERPGAPKIEISVNRAARRAAIPQQPSRTVTPKSDAQAQPPVARDRTDIVMQMMKDRAKPRHRIVA